MCVYLLFSFIIFIAMEVAFFIALYNTYVYILIYGYWPSDVSFSGGKK